MEVARQPEGASGFRWPAYPRTLSKIDGRKAGAETAGELNLRAGQVASFAPDERRAMLDVSGAEYGARDVFFSFQA
jgi:hypothetical protein